MPMKTCGLGGKRGDAEKDALRRDVGQCEICFLRPASKGNNLGGSPMALRIDMARIVFSGSSFIGIVGGRIVKAQVVKKVSVSCGGGREPAGRV
jgi:hypothetical protein